MPYHNYRKDLMGSAQITPKGSFEVGSWQSFKIEYKAGKFGIDDQGGIMIGMRPHYDGSKLQNINPKEEGYVTVETSTNIPIDFKIEIRRSIRPLQKNLYIICRRYLNENDRIIIRLGDQRFGSPGLRLQTFCEKKFDFKMLIDPFATQDFIPLPDEKNPEISIVPTNGVIWKLIAPSHRRLNEKFNIFIKCEDKWGNPSNKVQKKLHLFADELIEGLPKSVSFKKGEFSLTIRNLKIKNEGVYKIIIKDNQKDILSVSNPLIIKNSKYVHFWSDMHGQSRETIGTNTADEYFDFAKNKSFLDICGHQGNDFQITDEFWKQLNLITKKYNEDGVFLAIPGYEWSGNTSVGGDHNVWYKKENRPIFRSSRALISDQTKKQNDAHTSKDLIKKLIKEDALVVAHVGGRFADISYAHDAKLEPSVEIHSAWGTFDWILKDAFKLNYKIGIVAGSDGHKGRPGASFPGDSVFGSYGGLTCHLLEKLDRDNLFKEFRARHHYATTGARIYLDVQGCFDKQTALKVTSDKKLNITSCFMGDEVVTSSSSVDLKLNVEGTAPIEKIEIYDGLKLIKVYRPYEKETIKKRIRITCAGQNYRGRGRLVNWDCKAIFEAGKIKQFRGINFWNPNRQPIKNNLNSIEWKTVTTGGSSCVDIWVSEETFSKNLILENNFKNIKLNLKEIDKTPVQFDFGGMDIRLIIETLPIKLKQCHINETLSLKLIKNKEARIYVKVIQEDGHQAWSSPMYIQNK
jgi:hypothetical protein